MAFTSAALIPNGNDKITPRRGILALKFFIKQLDKVFIYPMITSLIVTDASSGNSFKFKIIIDKAEGQENRGANPIEPVGLWS